MVSKVKFKIANITFQFSSSYAKAIEWFKDRYAFYLSRDKSDLNIILEFKKGYKNGKVLNNPPALMSENGKFFLRTEFFDVRGNYSSGKIKVMSGYNLGVADLTRTLFSIFIVKRGGLLLHASAVADNTYSYVFCGPSESGKTTIARLSNGKDVLTDETTAIVKKGGRYYAYATPFFGELGKLTKNTGAPIKAVFFIHKSNGFSHRRKSRFEATQDFLYNTILQGRNSDLTEKILDNVSQLAESVQCYDLYFKPEAQLWEYINDIT